MIPRIKEIRPMKDFILFVVFDDGKHCLYDVKTDMAEIEQYRDLQTITGLFEQVQLDESRTCVFWNDMIDLPSDAIYEYGEEIEPDEWDRAMIAEAKRENDGSKISFVELLKKDGLTFADL